MVMILSPLSAEAAKNHEYSIQKSLRIVKKSEGFDPFRGFFVLLDFNFSSQILFFARKSFDQLLLRSGHVIFRLQK
ncbi:MAG: hypothetical protein IKY02_05065 [Lachnospiraceae bacterium]|nr:hypothetical protein [Lachnospiraceae bacterium]